MKSNKKGKKMKLGINNKLSSTFNMSKKEGEKAKSFGGVTESAPVETDTAATHKTRPTKSENVPGAFNIYFDRAREDSAVFDEFDTIDDHIFNRRESDEEIATTPNNEETNGDLVVANKVIENRDDFIPTAAEYNPDSKPSLYRRRRYKLYGILMLFTFLAIVVVSVSFLINRTKIVKSPTSLPTTFRESIGVQEVIENLIDIDKLEDSESSEAKALDWILNKDPMKLLPDSSNLIQRYLLAYFYYHTSSKGPWVDCNPPEGKQRETCNINKYLSPGVLTSRRSAGRWLSKRSECLWGGISCDSGEVTSINLDAQSLSGTIPTEIAKIPKLRVLNLNSNEFTGQLPSELAQVENLRTISLQFNFISGTFPQEWFGLQKLKVLDVYGNNMVGSIPMNLSNITTLNFLMLGNNAFTGTLPSNLFTISDLRYFKAAENQLVGTIPSEIGLLSDSLRVFRMERNALNGTLPPEVGKLKNLEFFSVSNNQLTGTIPDEIYNCSEVQILRFDNNKFAGTLSKKIGRLSPLTLPFGFRELFLNNNDFSGTIPSEIGKLSMLQDVRFQQNNFIGDIPHELCLLQGHFVIDLIADCLPPENIEIPFINCQVGCCTICCITDTKICHD